MAVSVSPAEASERPCAMSVRAEADRFWVALADGRVLGVPYSRFPLLAKATSEQRRALVLSADGRSINWPDLDEDVGVELLLYYTPRSADPHLDKRGADAHRDRLVQDQDRRVAG